MLVHAEGGAGKTSIARQLFAMAPANGFRPFLLPLVELSPHVLDVWRDDASSDHARLNALMPDIARPRVSEIELAAIAAQCPTLLLLDGLNELPSGVALRLLGLLDLLALRYPSLCVLVTDRLARRDLPSPSWQLATIAPLSTGAIRRILGHDPPADSLIASAFFLELARVQGARSTSGAAVLERWFTEHLGVDQEDLDKLSVAAFDLYRERESRTFPRQQLVDRVGDDLTRRLMEGGGIIGQPDDRAYFRHHLFHDYLAARWVAHHRESWEKNTFDVLTFLASSYDAVALALEQIQPGADADAFIRCVYDWNFYASAYAIARRRADAPRVSRGMEATLLAMLAERRWDPILNTAIRVNDALRLFPDPVARPYLATTSLRELVEFVRQIEIDEPEFSEWREVFTYSPAGPADPEVVALVNDSNSIIGWTATNVLKRVSITEHDASVIRSLLLESPDGTVRWRCAHVLGAHPSRMAIEALLSALNDTYRWVAYGAIRSLVEMAYRDACLRSDVLEKLMPLVAELSNHSRIIDEFGHALLLRTPPTGWALAVAPLVEELWAASPTIERQDHWRRLAHEIEIRQWAAA